MRVREARHIRTAAPTSVVSSGAKVMRASRAENWSCAAVTRGGYPAGTHSGHQERVLELLLGQVGELVDAVGAEGLAGVELIDALEGLRGA